MKTKEFAQVIVDAIIQQPSLINEEQAMSYRTLIKEIVDNDLGKEDGMYRKYDEIVDTNFKRIIFLKGVHYLMDLLCSALSIDEDFLKDNTEEIDDDEDVDWPECLDNSI